VGAVSEWIEAHWLPLLWDSRARPWAMPMPKMLCRTAVDANQVALAAEDTGKPVVCAAPKLSEHLVGVDVDCGSFYGPEQFRPIIGALVRAAAELPPAARDQDPRMGRWITQRCGAFELWLGRQARLIFCDREGEFGYTWEKSIQELYFYRSKSCKREGKRLATGSFKLSEQKRDAGKSYWNIDLLSDERDRAALIRLTPAGAGYKVFPRQLPVSFGQLPLLE
jgi:hypothetical protein